MRRIQSKFGVNKLDNFMENGDSTMKKCIFLVMVLLSGCTTISFENGSTSGKRFKTEKLHHNVVLGLVEVSDPVNLERECANQDWEEVQTQYSVFTWLAGRITYSMWDPKTVSLSCK
jgi:Bor protein